MSKEELQEKPKYPLELAREGRISDCIETLAKSVQKILVMRADTTAARKAKRQQLWYQNIYIRLCAGMLAEAREARHPLVNDARLYACLVPFGPEPLEYTITGYLTRNFTDLFNNALPSYRTGLFINASVKEPHTVVLSEGGMVDLRIEQSKGDELLRCTFVPSTLNEYAQIFPAGCTFYDVAQDFSDGLLQSKPDDISLVTPVYLNTTAQPDELPVMDHRIYGPPFIEE